MPSSPERCQACGGADALPDDALCAGCAGPVQLVWGLAHARGPMRGEHTAWTGVRRTVETVDPVGEYL